MNANDVFAEALATVEEAEIHGYCTAAAMHAAMDHLELADREELVMICGLLASWIAIELRPASDDLLEFLEHATAFVARGMGRG